jgi:fructose-1-phosphate kinase PfkB-like protein
MQIGYSHAHKKELSMILCVGTAPTVQRSMTFERLAIDEVNRAVQVLETASGKSINVARVLHTLGKEVLATGFLGGDSGRMIRTQLDLEHIGQEFVEVPFRTRTCTTVIDCSNGTHTELVEESQVVEQHYWSELEQLIARHLPGSRAMVLSGGLPPKAPQTSTPAAVSWHSLSPVPSSWMPVASRCVSP